MSETSINPSPDPSGEHPIVHRTETASVSDRAESNLTTQRHQETENVIESQYPPLPERTTKSELLKYLLSAVILLVGVGAMFGLYLLKEAPKEFDSKELVPMVGIAKAMNYNGQLDKVISGTVVPFREIKVAAEVNGVVAKKYDVFEAGNFVKKGTKLIEIDAQDYELQLKTGLAEVEQSQKMLEETQEEVAGTKRNIQLAKNEYQLAQSDHQRNTRIQNALSSSELDQSKRSLLAAESALIARKNSLEMLNAKEKRLQASLALTKAQLERTKLNLAKTTIVAPDDGVIVREMVQEGDFVRMGDQLVTFEDTSRSEIICNLTPTDLAWVRDNSPANENRTDDPSNENLDEAFSVYYIPKTDVSVYEIGNPNVVWEGVLERFDGIGRDAATRTIPCRITIEKPIIATESGQRALVRGMYVKCKIQVQSSADNAKRTFISFPAVALRPGNIVWTVVDKKLQQHTVEVVDYGERLIDEELVKIVVVAEKEGSLKRGDEIVTTPLAQPSVGAEVLLEGEQVGDVDAEADDESDESETETLSSDEPATK
jgi:multidrug efflux pump subunit AcrA (membrane-fusion protein)